MYIPQRRKPGHAGVFHGMTLFQQGGQGCVDLTGVPQDDRIQHEPEYPELVFLALAVPLA